MPSCSLGLKYAQPSSEISLSKARVPLEALQMLTQSVSKCGQEYIQPLPLKEEEQKKSPLALLAATCSSIGKSETSKTTLTAESDNTSQANKISSEETRSSFKPYKQALEKADEMAEKAGFRAPSKESPSISPALNSSSKDQVSTKLPAYQFTHVDSDSQHCMHSQGRICGVFYDSVGQSSNGVHSLHKDCSGSCAPHPGNLVPYKPALPFAPSLAGQESPAVKTHALPTSMANVGSVYPAGQCGCGFCMSHSAEASPLGNLAARPLQMHNPSTPFLDYLQRTVCRDANCTSCKPQSPYGLYNPSVQQQCGPHCAQCENIKTEQAGAPAALQSYYYQPHGLPLFTSSQDESQPFVCNWVSGSKHCGTAFPTSEDLFQHLRTHTQIGNSAANQAQLSCNVHGCPCKLRASPTPPSALQSSLHSARYRPYYYKPSALPPAACYPSSPYAMHSLAAYDHHRLFK